jgi:site-specific recombinase XerC
VGKDKIRHFVTRGGRFYWQPSETIANLGMTAEALGTEPGAARARAISLNNLADELRRSANTGANDARPGSVGRLFADYKASEEFGDLKPRTRKDYAYYLDKIEMDFAKVMVRALTPKVIKTYYKRVRKQKGVTWAYHILSTFRTVLSWAVSEDWIKQNPALEVSMRAPAKRKVVWTPEQTQTYIDKALELGWHSIVAIAHVFDSIGQSPVDVRTLLRKAYDGRCIDVSRTKTGITGAPIPLFPQAVEALNAYLASQPPKLPEAPLFTHDKIGGMWNESPLQKTHAKIRTAAKLPKQLQLQDFRTTAATEAGAAGATVDEIKGLQRHSSRAAGEHYVHPNREYVENTQQKRLARRNEQGAKVGSAE